MKIPNTEELEIKVAIAATAADLYVQNEGEFTIHQVAEALDVEVSDIFNYFPDKKSIIDFYYTSLVLRYRLMIDEIDDFDNYTLSEKLSNFLYVSLDLLGEKRAFVAMTFSSHISCTLSKTAFETEAEALFQELINDDPGLSVSSRLLTNSLFYKLLLQKYLFIINYWLKDRSEEKERTMELIDKLTALIQEVLYNKVADQTFELGKFLWTNSGLNLSFWDKLSSKIEIR